VAAADPSVAFIVAVSPCGVTPAEQMDHAARSALRAAGQPEAPALALRASVNDCYRGPQIDRGKALALIESARGEPWFEHALLPDPSDPADDSWAADLDFDVTPALRALDVPALALFGGRDRWIPVDRSIAVWGAALGARLSTTVLGEAGHALTTSFEPDDPEEAGPLDSGYEPALEKWLRDVVGELRQHVRGG
jgi:pimeloyl-ACP methyl ester carboxylesterase